MHRPHRYGFPVRLVITNARRYQAEMSVPPSVDVAHQEEVQKKVRSTLSPGLLHVLEELLGGRGSRPWSGSV